MPRAYSSTDTSTGVAKCKIANKYERWEYITMNKRQFTDEHEKLIESNFENVYKGTKKALIVIELVKSSLVDEDSDTINKNTSPYDTREALRIATE